VALRLVGFLILIPWLGVLGAALSATLSLAMATVALNWLCRRRTGVDPSILVLLRFSPWKAKPRAAPAGDSNI
jgi:Na+-driven multidrug efflux pump